MKTIEKISPVLEKVLLKGLSLSSYSQETTIMSSTITFFYLEDKFFVFFKNKNSYANTSIASVYEIGINESSFLSVTLDSIVFDYDFLDEVELKKTKKLLYEKALSFCQTVNFPCKEIEFFIKDNPFS